MTAKLIKRGEVQQASKPVAKPVAKSESQIRNDWVAELRAKKEAQRLADQRAVRRS